MKYKLAIITALAFAKPALACTKSELKAQSRLIKMFQLDGSPVDWVSVKIKTDQETQRKSVHLNRAFPVKVEATNRINSSRIKYKRDTYDLRSAKICSQGKRVLISHPKGELVVFRSGHSLGDSEIALKQNGGFFKLRLRPEKIVGR